MTCIETVTRTIHPDGSMTEVITKPTNSISIKQTASGKVIIDGVKVYASKEDIEEELAVYVEVALTQAAELDKELNPE